MDSFTYPTAVWIICQTEQTSVNILESGFQWSIPCFGSQTGSATFIEILICPYSGLKLVLDFLSRP